MDSPLAAALSNPARPLGIPECAAWDWGEDAWVIQSWDANGQLHGAVRVYGRNGALQLALEYRHGKRHGPFQRYHGSGRVAQVGRYYEDHLDGLTTSWSAGDESDSIRTCCIPPQTRVLKQEHRFGAVLREAFFGADGYPLAEPSEPTAPELREREDDVLLGECGFWPGLERLPAVEGAEAVTIAQPFTELQGAICRAAQRVGEYRARLLELAPTLAPPDVSALVRDGLELRTFELQLSESDVPGRIEEGLDLHDVALPELAWRARLEWTALCWLCWAAGASAVRVPEEPQPQPQLYAALVHASARVEALEGFAPAGAGSALFHGLEEALLPASALARLAEHYREIRAVLLFATDPECVSAWQDDLGRRV